MFQPNNHFVQPNINPDSQSTLKQHQQFLQSSYVVSMSARLFADYYRHIAMNITQEAMSLLYFATCDTFIKAIHEITTNIFSYSFSHDDSQEYHHVVKVIKLSNEEKPTYFQFTIDLHPDNPHYEFMDNGNPWLKGDSKSLTLYDKTYTDPLSLRFSMILMFFVREFLNFGIELARAEKEQRRFGMMTTGI